MGIDLELDRTCLRHSVTGSIDSQGRLLMLQGSLAPVQGQIRSEGKPFITAGPFLQAQTPLFDLRRVTTGI